MAAALLFSFRCAVFMCYKLRQALNSQAKQWLFLKRTIFGRHFKQSFFICNSRQTFERQKYHKNTNKSVFLDGMKSIWIGSTGNMDMIKLVQMTGHLQLLWCDQAAKSALEQRHYPPVKTAAHCGNVLRLVHQHQWWFRVYTGRGVATPGQKSARDETVLELSCQRSKGSQLYWGQCVCVCVCVCVAVSMCDIFDKWPWSLSQI